MTAAAGAGRPDVIAPVPDDAPYKDASRPVEERLDDLLARMTVEEKAGQLFQDMVTVGEGGTLAEQDAVFGTPSVHEYVVEKHMTHLNVLGAPGTATDLAAWHNRVQEVAASTRLGIPVTIASDPRHAFSDNPLAALAAGPFSQWPETLGLAAIGDPDLVERFADTVRREYVATGLRTALHPQVDLATEPRWARASGTFGEDVALTTALGVAYVHGLQGTGAVAREGGLDRAFGAASVSAMSKHFPGGGPQLDGEDPHFAYGREQVYPGGRFAEHLEPFRAVIAAGTRQLMPYYGMPVGLEVDGRPVPQVGFGFNRPIITGLLRETLGYEGVVCTDWGLVSDAEIMGRPFPARAWGVERLSRHERVAAILDAGCDQLGGEACPEIVVDLVRDGSVPEERLDVSVRRLLREKFLLGLFDEQRYVDVEAAARLVGTPEARAAGRAAQSAAVTVLTSAPDGAAHLPLTRGLRVYAEGVPADVVAGYGEPVATPAEADVAVLRLTAPFEDRGPGFEQLFHAGSLEFPAAEVERVLAVCDAVPTVLAVYLDRPAVLAPFVGRAASLVAEYGASGEALLDALTGAEPARGRLPFDLPSSMAAVVESRPDVAHDTAHPLFRAGHGLGRV